METCPPPFAPLQPPLVVAGKEVSCFLLAGQSPAPFSLTLVDLEDLETSLNRSLPEETTPGFLSTKEQELFTRFRFPKRRREWLGGRLACKYSVLQLLQIPASEQTLASLSVLPLDSGAPFLEAPFLAGDLDLPAVSISHSGKFAAGLAAGSHSCGVDIQQTTEKTERVAERFCKPGETQILSQLQGDLPLHERLTLLWAAKEAVKKALLENQPVVFRGVTLVSVQISSGWVLAFTLPGGHKGQALVHGQRFSDSFLAYTIPDRRHA